ncbi:hypothetical protein Patl1_07163 [Pistacia atlantica]|uniref:Uncharacterized protein n=1 Tax=Pistacia atlantica TaxID=434234 RepID=A0ACC1AJS5_9ROSI|nr:hypothetical protein Patl1_07163 [Pistacia atlantica]
MKLEDDMSKRVSSLQNPVTNPDMYSATLAKEATTVRRVLKPLFHHFDVENHGSSDIGVACSVILYLQLLLEELGGNSHLLLSILIKHLDHKNVAKQPRAFPDALFHQLLLAMAHPDHETRVGAHSVVSVVLCHLGSPLGVRSGRGKDTSQVVSSILPVFAS